jgi:hypothetical protein
MTSRGTLLEERGKAERKQYAYDAANRQVSVASVLHPKGLHLVDIGLQKVVLNLIFGQLSFWQILCYSLYTLPSKYKTLY